MPGGGYKVTAMTASVKHSFLSPIPNSREQNTCSHSRNPSHQVAAFPAKASH